MKKKFLLMLFSFLLVFALIFSGCENSNEKQNNDVNNNTENTQKLEGNNGQNTNNQEVDSNENSNKTDETNENTDESKKEEDEKMENDLYTNVKDFGAIGDGKADDSVAIQKAIDSLEKTGGTVYLPPGVYRMASGVKIPVGVNVEGETYATTGPWQQFLDAQDKNLKAIQHYHMSEAGDKYLQFNMYKGTWILVDHGMGDVNSHPTFQLSGSSSIKKLGFVHKNLPPITTDVVEHPPAVALISDDTIPYTRDGVTIEDISIANAYIGIAIVAGKDIENNYLGISANDITRSCGRHRVHNIMGGAIYKGMLFKGLLDTVDISNIQFNYTNYESGYVRARAENCTDIEFVRGDGMSITDVLSFGAKYGLRTIPGYGDRHVSIRATNLNLEGQIPMSLKASGQYEITNSYFLTIKWGDRNIADDDEFICVEIETDDDCIHQSHILLNNLFLQNSIMSGDLYGQALNVKLNAGSNVILNNAMFWGWDSTNGGESIISYTHKTPGMATLNINNSTFTSTSKLGKLIAMDGKGLKPGDVLFSNCRMPSTIEAKRIMEENIAWFNFCTQTKANGENEILTTK